MWETWVRSLGWEEPLEKQMATHSRILAWRIPWTIQSKGSQTDTVTERPSLSFFSLNLMSSSRPFNLVQVVSWLLLLLLLSRFSRFRLCVTP